MVAHPTPLRLAAFLRGELRDPELSDVGEHLEGCPSCCSHLTTQDQGDPFITRLRAAVLDPARPPGSSAGGPPAAERPVPAIPGYELLREVGRGGMGIVYEARQSALNRTVAIKLLLNGAMAGPEEVSRFRAEARAIARLDHPNVVPIYETGTLDGKPFVVLEYVAGGTLAGRTRGTPQPPRAAAEVARQVAGGAQAAHEAGIVHRDLKPANVLLSGPLGVPKIGDFGLAKALDAAVGLTASGQTPGTPSYMAPEQTCGGAVGPAADVYAIGAILYELLTGRPPFVGVSAVDILDQVRNQEPVPPTWLQRAVPRDLETVCLKCLQKEPARRYPTAGALRDDLARFLDGRPILARPVGVGERAFRWCRRNPKQAVLAASLAASLGLLGLGGVASSVAFSEQASRQKELAGEADRSRLMAQVEQGVAVAAAKQASDEAERATQVTQFLKEMFQPHDQLFVGSACLGFRNPKDATAVSDVLRHGLAKLNGGDGFRGRPLVRAELLHDIGTAYFGLGHAGEAEPMIAEALTLYRANLPPGHPDLGRSILAFAQARSLLDDEVKDDLFQEAIAVFKKAPDPDDLALIDAETGYAFFTWYLHGSTGETARLFERSYAVRKRKLGEHHIQTQTTLLALVQLRMQEDQYAEAVPLLATLMASLQKGDAPPDLLGCCQRMTSMFAARAVEGPRAATPHARKLVEQLAQVFGPHHYLTVHAKLLLAWMLGGPQAIAAYREGLDGVETWGLPSLFLRAKITFNIARVLQGTGGDIESEVEYRESIRLFRQLATKKSQRRAEYPYALQQFAKFLTSRGGAQAQAEVGRLLDEGADYCRRNPSVPGYRRAFALTDAGHWRLQHGDRAPCAKLFAEAAAYWRQDPRPLAHRFAAEALALQCYALRAQGKLEEAEAVRRECEVEMGRELEQGTEQVGRARELLAGRLPSW